MDWLSKNFQRRFGYIFEKCSEYEKRWNESIDFVGKFHSRWITDAVTKEIDIEKEPFLKGFWEISMSGPRINCIEICMWQKKNLFDPLIQHCEKMLPSYYALILLEELLICKAAVENHRSLRNASIEEFNSYSEQLEKMYKQMMESLNELKKTQKY